MKCLVTFLALFVAISAGLTVDDVAKDTDVCSTISVAGLSLQLVDQMNCLVPNSMKSIDVPEAGIKIGKSVFPYLQKAAADDLIRAVSKSKETITINSALRTIPQQYILYRRASLGLCGITAAALPGRSNHNGGIAIDVGSYTTWIPRLQNWTWFGDTDKVHFTYNQPTPDLRSISTKAFQLLWNLNNPNDTLVVDGEYGANTERRLRVVSADGFQLTGCDKTKRFNDLLESKRAASKRDTYGSCTYSGQAGTCMSTSDCTGTYYSNLCPNTPNDIKCCVASGAPDGGKSINDNGIKLIQSYEGWSASWYKDSVGIETIGYGHACQESVCRNLDQVVLKGKRLNGSYYTLSVPLTREQGSDLMRGDLDNLGFEDCVNKAVTANINDNQFASLVSFAFNLGCGSLKSSSLLRDVNAGASADTIRADFLKWNKAGGKVLSGLTRRRSAEADLYQGILTLNSREVSRDIDFDPNGSGVGAECWHYGEKGVCLPTAYCTGFNVKGLCPGAADIQCCLRKRCDATSSGSQDGQCALANACNGTIVEGAACTGATDLKCCKGTIPEPTTTCPDGATWNTTNRWCQTNDGGYALGPFTRAMISKCSAVGGNDDICVVKYPFVWNGEKIMLFKWPIEFARSVRGTDPCMLGSAPNTNYLGYCLESISVLANSTAGVTTVVSQRNVYGAMRSDLQDSCKGFAGGLACNTPRWDGEFFRTIAVSGHLSIIPTDESGNTDDENGSSLDTSSNIWVTSQWILSSEHKANFTDAPGSNVTDSNSTVTTDVSQNADNQKSSGSKAGIIAVAVIIPIVVIAVVVVVVIVIVMKKRKSSDSDESKQVEIDDMRVSKIN